MAIMTAQQTAIELQRKKNLGIAPTSSANLGQYNSMTATPKANTPTTGMSAQTAQAYKAASYGVPTSGVGAAASMQTAMPKVNTPQGYSPTANPSSNGGMSAAAVTAELARKASLGIAPTNSSNLKEYNTMVPQPTNGGMSAQQVQAELQRKKNLGITPTSSANLPTYNALTAVPDPNKATLLSSGGYSPPYSGGFNYGEDKAKDAAYNASSALWKNDPAAKQSEIDRTLGIIAGMEARGEDTSAQKKHLERTLGYNPGVDTLVEEPVEELPVEEVVKPNFYELALAEGATGLAEYRRLAEAGKTSLTSAYERANQLETEQRVEDNLWFQRNASPFTGQTDHKKRGIMAQRTESDEATQNQYLAGIRGYDESLANQEASSAQTAQARAWELEQQWNAQQLAEAGMTGTLGTTRTMAGTELDYNMSPTNPNNVAQGIANEINRLKLTNLPAELKLGLEALQLDVSAGKLSQKEAEYKLKELQDPNSITNQVAKLELEAAKLGNQELRKRIAEIGKKPAMTQSEKRLKEIALEKAEMELTKLQSGQPQTAESYAKNIKPRYVNGVLANPQEVEDQIILSGLTDYEQFKLYKKYGITWDDPIPTQ